MRLVLAVALGLCLLGLAGPAAAQRSVTTMNRYKVARTQFEQGNYERAAQALEALVKEDSGFIDAQYLLGLAYLGLKKYPEARERMEETIKIDKLFLPAYQFLGQILIEEKKFPQAREHFMKMLAVPGGGTTARYCLGVVAYVQKDLAGAEGEWRETLRLDPKHASAHNNLGILRQAEGKHREALAEFKTASRLQPENPTYWFNQAWEHAELGDKPEARRALESMKRRTGQKRRDLEDLGLALFAWLEGRSEVVINACKRALQGNPELTQAWILQARALEQQKQASEARAAWTAVLESDPNVKEAEQALKRLPEPAASPGPGPPGASPTPSPAAPQP